jgi:molecular chaperone DnaK
LGGVFTKLIGRNTTIPTRKSEVFSTAADGQTSVEVHVLQGEREMATGNKTLGRFHLDGIPPAPRGTPQVEVAFDIDANGIVHVSAKDLGTGKEQKITISASSGLAKDEVDRLVRDAESHAAEDKSQREAVETRNRADQLVYQVQKTLNENAAKLADADTAPVRTAVDEVKAALEKGEAGAIRAAAERLEKASHRLAEVIYKSASPATDGAPQTPAQEKPADDVIDAEVVDGDHTKN